MGSNTGTCSRGRKSNQGLELVSLGSEGTAANLSVAGVEFRSLAWPLLPQPSSLSSLSVPKLPCPGSSAGLTAWQGLPLARSQLGWLGSAGSRSVEGSGRSDSIPKSGK